MTDETLSKDSGLDVGFGDVTLFIDFGSGRILMRQYVGGFSENDNRCPTVKDMEKEYGSRMDKAERVTLFINTPLHDETYEYNKEDGEWYLIRKGRGFA